MFCNFSLQNGKNGKTQTRFFSALGLVTEEKIKSNKNKLWFDL